MAEGAKDRDKDLHNVIICPKCGSEYDSRYLSEACRRVEGIGYLCPNCNTPLTDEKPP